MAIIAEIVSNAFGGLITKSEIVEFGYEMAIVELKRSQNSNVIPLGKIKKGLYRERALLFKIICDQVGLPVTLGKNYQKNDYQKILNYYFRTTRVPSSMEFYLSKGRRVSRQLDQRTRCPTLNQQPQR